MSVVLCLLAVQGALGAFDTLWFHEWRARLPALGALSAAELRLHALRSIVYAMLFATLPWIEWRGAWAAVLLALLASEIAITLADFVVEERVRKPLGGVHVGERLTHVVMGIVYGAMLACLVPEILAWQRLPSALALAPVEAPPGLRATLGVMAAGVLASGMRDGLAALGVRGASWPWRRVESASA